MRKNWKFYQLNDLRDIKKEKGFTLLEVLVALSISTLCFLLLSIGITQTRTIREQVEEDKQIEWHLFLNQLEHYLEDSELVSVSRDSLTVKEPKKETGELETVSYVRPQTNRSVLIRRVNNGNQRLLSQVNWVRFSRSGEILEVEGYFQNGETYNARLRINNWEANEE